MADQEVYKPIEYSNSNLPGPCVILAPGSVKSKSFAFKQRFGENNIRDFAEIELSKASFSIIDNADKRELYKELALAANLGDKEAVRVFRKKNFHAANYLLRFDVIKAEPVAFESTGGSGEAIGALIELGFLIANKGRDNGVGSAIGATVASLKHYETKATWDVGLKYAIVDITTGEVVAEKELGEQHVATTELNAALGVQQKDAYNLSLDTMVQRLVQKAIAEIDKEQKPKLRIEAMNEELPESPKAKKAHEALVADYRNRVQEQEIENDKDRALETMHAWSFAYSNLDMDPLLTLANPKMHEFVRTEFGPFFKMMNVPGWRATFTIDVSNIQYEIIEYSTEKCKIQKKGYYRYGPKGKEENIYETEGEPTLLLKENGEWKIASSSVRHKNPKGEYVHKIDVSENKSTIFDGYKVGKMDMNYVFATSEKARELVAKVNSSKIRKGSGMSKEEMANLAAKEMHQVVEKFCADNKYDFVLESTSVKMIDKYGDLKADSLVYHNKDRLAEFLQKANSDEGKAYLRSDAHLDDISHAFVKAFDGVDCCMGR